MANTVRILITAKDEISGQLDKIRDKATLLSKTDIGKGMAMGAGIAAFSAVKGVADEALQAVGRFAAGSIAAASDQREAMSLTQQVFEGSTESVKEWAKNKKDAFSTTEALNFASQFGTAFKNVGMTLDETTAKAETMTTLAGDLGSAFNTSSSEAAIALKSGLLGESEPLRRFGVFLDETKVKAQAAAMGMKPLHGALTDGQKVAARYALIMEQTADSQGMFGRDTDSLADASKKLESNIADLQVGIGQGLTPVLTDATEATLGLLASFDSDSTTTFEDRLKGLTDVVNVLNPATWSMGGAFDGFHKSMDAASEAADRDAAAAAMAWDTGSERIGASFHNVGEAATKASSTTRKALDRIVWKAEEVRDKLNGLGSDAADSYFDPIIVKAELAANQKEQAELRWQIASKKLGKEELAAAKLRLTELQKDAMEKQVALIGFGKMNKKQQAEFLEDLRRKWRSATGEAKDDITALIAYIENIPTSRTVNVTVKSHFVGTGNDAGRAAGGPVSPYQSYAYNEGNQAEVLYSGASAGRVMPSGGGSGDGGGMSVSINISAPVLTPGSAQAVADAIGPALTKWQQQRHLIGR